MRKSFYIILTLFLMISCQETELFPVYDMSGDDLYSSMEVLESTKTSMDDNNNVLWSEEDQLVAFMKTTLGTRYEIKEQYVGTTTGGFSKVSDSGSGDDLESGQEIDHNVVLYPYSSEVWCMKNDSYSPARSYKLNAVLPETQYYSENTFGNGSFPMVAVSSSNQLTFKNVCGGLKLQFKGVDKIKSIKLEGLCDELISGKSTVVGYVDGSSPVITMNATRATKSITLDCGSGVQLNESTPTTFIISVPPVTFSSGMKITVTDTDGMSRTLTNTSPNTIRRSSLLTFPVITYTQSGVFELAEGSQTSYEVLAEGGTIEIPLLTNQDYDVVISEGAGEWITLVDTRVLREETIILDVAENMTLSSRSAEVLITSKGETLQVISISQETNVQAFDLSLYGTANSYIINEAGTYVFPTVRGNSSISVGTPISAEVLWESFGTSTCPKVGDLIESVSYMNGYVIFSTPESFNDGNAVIAVKDDEGNILWSWHIWCASEGYKEHIYANNAGTMMDRNLGATSAVPGNVGALGLLYQWGRKDPFLGSSSISSSSSTAKHVSSNGNQWNRISGGVTIEYVTANPMTFITNPYSSGNLDWYSTADGSSNSTLWQSEKTEYDPCPPGWKVPDGYGEGIWATAGFDDMTYDAQNQGILFPSSICGSEAWYPAAGLYTASGSLYSVRFAGAYWSTTPNVNGSMNYYLSLNNEGEVNPSASTGYQVLGYSVRCQKENTGGGVNVPENIVPTDLSEEGTANCYVVTEPGIYSFPAVKGNSSSSVGAPFRAKVIWESFGTDETPKIGDVIASAYYSDGYVVFTTPEVLRDGNALIALVDASNDILWSWHIWCASDGYKEQVYANNAGIMMDRNLGAISANPGEIGSLGLRYQWGRKDPFLSSSSFDEEIQPQSTYIWPAEVESSSSVGMPSYATKNPTTYIKGTYIEQSPNNYVGTSDWYYYSPYNNLWTSEKTIYDPCPAGWRVCDGGEDGVWAVAGFPNNRTHNKLDIYDSVHHGYLFDSSICGNDSWYPVMDGYSSYHSVTPSDRTDIAQYCIYILNLSEYNTVIPDELGTRESLYFVRCQKIN